MIERAENLEEANAQLREPATFEFLFQTEFRPIVSTVYRILGDRDGAVDVAEEAFTRLAQHWARVQRYGKPGAWLRTVAIRIAIRNRFHRYRESQQVVQPDFVNPVDETALLVREAVMELPRIQRAVVILHYFEDQLIEDIAETVGCRKNTVKAHLFKARAKLRVRLAGVYSGD